MRIWIHLGILVSALSSARGGEITARAAGQFFEGKKAAPVEIVTQGEISVFDAGTRFAQLNNETVATGSGLAAAYGTADHFSLEVDTSSGVQKAQFLGERIWTLVSADFGMIDEWFEFQASEPFTVEVVIRTENFPRLAGGLQTNDATNQNSHRLGETWQVYDAAGDLQTDLTWSPFYAENNFLSAATTTTGEAFSDHRFDLQPGWRLRRSCSAFVSARARALDAIHLFSSGMRLTVSTEVTVVAGTGRLAATSSLARYDGSANPSARPALEVDRNGLLALRHPVVETAGKVLEFSPDLATWTTATGATQVGSTDPIYSILPLPAAPPAFFRFVDAPVVP